MDSLNSYKGEFEIGDYTGDFQNEQLCSRMGHNLLWVSIICDSRIRLYIDRFKEES